MASNIPKSLIAAPAFSRYLNKLLKGGKNRARGKELHPIYQFTHTPENFCQTSLMQRVLEQKRGNATTKTKPKKNPLPNNTTPAQGVRGATGAALDVRVAPLLEAVVGEAGVARHVGAALQDRRLLEELNVLILVHAEREELALRTRAAPAGEPRPRPRVAPA